MKVDVIVPICNSVMGGRQAHCRGSLGTLPETARCSRRRPVSIHKVERVTERHPNIILEFPHTPIQDTKGSAFRLAHACVHHTHAQTHRHTDTHARTRTVGETERQNKRVRGGNSEGERESECECQSTKGPSLQHRPKSKPSFLIRASVFVSFICPQFQPPNLNAPE